jgi:hypothetical protein
MAENVLTSGNDKPQGKNEDESFEVLFTILVSIAAVLAGVGGYFAASANGVDTEAKINAQLSYNDANVEYLIAIQTYTQDSNLQNDAFVAEYEGKTDIAKFLMSQTTMYRGGYYDLDGYASSNYSGDEEMAWDAYMDGLYESYDMYYKDYEASNNVSILASKASGNCLLASVLLATSAVFGTVGMSANARKIRLTFLWIVMIFVIVSSGIIVVTLIS